MTHHLIRVEPDGTRVYSNYTRYKPKVDRTYGVRRPDDPRAVRFHGKWFLPLEVLSDGERRLPETRPDDEAIGHRFGCGCKVCRRPQALKLKRKAAGLRP